MAEINTFSALRYTNKAGKISDLVSKPYDVINKAQQNLAKKNQYNVVHLELPSGKNPYKASLETLNKWKQDGILSLDKSKCFYIYEDEFIINGKIKKIMGFIGLSKLYSYESDKIFPHENTLSIPRNDRFNLLKETCCNFSPIYFIYKDSINFVENALNKYIIVNKPIINFNNNLGLKTKIWVLDDEKLNLEIIEKFKQKKLYIADGHHRYSAALEFKDYCNKHEKYNNINSDYVMAMFVSDKNPGLEILPTHRIIKNNFNFDLDKFLKEAKKYFSIKKFNEFTTVKEEFNKLITQDKKVFILCSSFGEFILLELKDKNIMEDILPNASEDLKYLSVNILHELIFERILNISKDDINKQKFIKYTQDEAEAIDEVNKKMSTCSFLVPATSIDEICNIAENKEKMPQKSTYFYPKITSGILFNDLRKLN